MNILYAIQATGNGHISRAMELLPFLKEYGNIDIFLSGGNSHLSLDAPIKYRSKGLSLYYNCNGGLDYWQILKGIHPRRIRNEIRDLPVEKYDLVLNDFDYITSAACAKKKIPSINYGHQASFLSANTPRPNPKNSTGEWILRNYARATHYVGLHFKAYDNFIFTPVIKQNIIEAMPTDKGHITVYLPSYCEPQLMEIFSAFGDLQFDVFCGQIAEPKQVGNLKMLPVNKKLFNESLIHCSGLITGGGFETPAEALHLGKKILSIPIRSQYEQQCNGAALQEMGVRVLKAIDHTFKDHVEEWINNDERIQMDYSKSIPQSLEYLFGLGVDKAKAEVFEVA